MHSTIEALLWFPLLVLFVFRECLIIVVLVSYVILAERVAGVGGDPAGERAAAEEA